MLVPFFCFLTLFGLSFSQVLVAPTTILTPGTDAATLAALTAGVNNSTLGIPIPPPEFDLTYEIGGPKLRITSCLMNTIAALKELALGDWDGKVIDGTEYRLDNYPEVSIIMTTPRRRRNVQARFVMWAICLGVYDMISKKKFEFAQFEMSWKGQLLGWVQVVNHPPSADLKTEGMRANSTMDLGNKSATLPSPNRTLRLEPINITNIVTMGKVDDPAEARLNVTFEPIGVTLGVYDVFVPIMSGLTDMAKLPSTFQSSGLIIGLEGFKGFICILPSLPLRTSPPFMEYAWLIRAITRIPSYMLEKSRFGEINMNIAVDGVNVGFGSLNTRPDCHPDASPPASLGAAES
ncbi:MAG: hypothetical protein Q9161_009415 [Pseudevernia consocians]